MLDRTVRQVLDPVLDRAARHLDRPGISPNGLTALGLVVGLGSAAASAGQWWWWALASWLLSRALDGLDGPLARRRARAGAQVSQAGGFFDITADFTVYGATVVGVAIGATQAHGGSWLPFLLVLLAYYVNGTAFLAFSSIAERTGHQIDDGRSLSFLGGLAEGTETIAVHSLWLLVPGHAGSIAWVWAAVVAVSAAHRIVTGLAVLDVPAGGQR